MVYLAFLETEMKAYNKKQLQNEWRNPYLQWWAAGMPSFETQKLDPWKQITIKFKTKEDRQAFSELYDYELTDKTPVVWYPKKDRESNIKNGYVDENEL